MYRVKFIVDVVYFNPPYDRRMTTQCAMNKSIYYSTVRINMKPSCSREIAQYLQGVKRNVGDFIGQLWSLPGFF